MSFLGDVWLIYSVVTMIAGGAVVLFLCYVLFSLAVLLQGAFFAPSSAERIEAIIKLAAIKPGQKIVDLGSGDGRVLFALASATQRLRPAPKLWGYEIDPWLWVQSRWQAHKLSRQNPRVEAVKLIRGSFWSVDLAAFDCIVVYGIGHIMERLAEKITNECKPGTKIISVYFALPGRKPDRVISEGRLYTL